MFLSETFGVAKWTSGFWEPNRTLPKEWLIIQSSLTFFCNWNSSNFLSLYMFAWYVYSLGNGSWQRIQSSTIKCLDIVIQTFPPTPRLKTTQVHYHMKLLALLPLSARMVLMRATKSGTCWDGWKGFGDSNWSHTR